MVNVFKSRQTIAKLKEISAFPRLPLRVFSVLKLSEKVMPRVTLLNQLRNRFSLCRRAFRIRASVANQV
jgi:hypothetical protein